jgi:SpoVK/Ycf46/Vps4 family AAA+-type ATPase
VYKRQQLERYSGADIVQVCLRAGTLAFLDAVERGVEREITWADFEKVLDEIKPSVTARELERFEHYARTGE